MTEQGRELSGADWIFFLGPDVHLEYGGAGTGRRVFLRVDPENENETPGPAEEADKVTSGLQQRQVSPGDAEPYLLYITEFQADDGTIWNRLRLGFFRSRQAALEVGKSFKKVFPEAWVTRVSEAEQRTAGQGAIAIAAMRITPILTALEENKKEMKADVGVTLPPMTKERLAALIDEAEKEMTAGNYPRAILIYTRILQDPEHKDRKRAQELLALARERSGQLAHARAEYEKFLQMYPEGEDAERVKQRLAGLLTARAAPKAQLKKSSSPDRLEVFGSVSQYGYYDEQHPKEGTSIITRQTLANDLVFNVRKRTPNFESRTLFVGGYEADGTSDDNETRINTFYIDADDKKKISGRLGRQSKSSGGVLGRFDGGFLSYKLASGLTANLVGGFPVDSSGLDRFATDKYFYGVSFDVGALAKYWNVSTFFINQEEAGVIDRRAAGGEIRFFHPRASFFVLADYDLYFDDLNTALFTGNINLPNKTTINLSADYRNSPILLSNSALGGIAGRKILDDPGNLADYVLVEDLGDLTLFLGDEEIRDITRQKNYKTASYSLGIVQPISKKLQIGLDGSATKQYSAAEFTTPLFVLGENSITGDPEAQPVIIPAIEETPFQYIYTLQLISSNLIKEGDIAVISGSYRDQDTQEIYSAAVNTRYPISRYWRVNPRLNATFTKYRGLDSTQLKIRPLFRMDYRFQKPRMHFTLEAGAEWLRQEPDDAINTTSYFGSLGYRYDF